MKTLLISVFMIFASLQMSYADESKQQDQTDTTPVKVIREIK